MAAYEPTFDQPVTKLRLANHSNWKRSGLCVQQRLGYTAGDRSGETKRGGYNFALGLPQSPLQATLKDISTVRVVI